MRRLVLVAALGGCMSPSVVLEHLRDVVTALEIESDPRGKQPGQRILDDKHCMGNPLAKGCL